MNKAHYTFLMLVDFVVIKVVGFILNKVSTLKIINLHILQIVSVCKPPVPILYIILSYRGLYTEQLLLTFKRLNNFNLTNKLSIFIDDMLESVNMYTHKKSVLSNG